MAVIPTYEPRAKLEPGKAPNPQLSNAEAAAAYSGAQALQGAGGAIARFGFTVADVLQHQQNQAERDENTKTALNYDNTIRQQQADLIASREKMPADGAGFQKERLKAFDDATSKFLGSLPERLRTEYAERIKGQRISFGSQAGQEELGQAKRFAKNTVSELASRAENDVAANPDAADPSIERLTKIVNDSRLSPEEKLAAIASIRQRLQVSELKTRYGRDPDRMGAALGRSQSAGTAMSFFIGKGWTKEQAAGIVGNLLAESGLNTGAVNPGDGADGSNSIGIAQWNSGRAVALRAFAAARGKPASDLQTQLEFVDHELRTSHASAGAKLKAATTVEAATAAIVTDFERPKGSDRGAESAHNWRGRLAHARGLASGKDYGNPKYADLPPQTRDALIGYAAKGAADQQRANRVEQGEVQKLIQDDIASIKATGEGVKDLEPSRVIGAFGPEGAQRWQDERTRAAGVYRATAGMESMPGTEIESRVEALRPRPGDAGAGFSARTEIYNSARERAEEIIRQRTEDPAEAVSGTPTVRAARAAVEAAPSTQTREAAVAASLQAQSALGIPSSLQSPITVSEAKQYASRLRPLARGQAEAVDQNRIIESVVADIEGKYGSYAKDVLTKVLYQVTLKKDAADVLATAIRRMHTTDSGPVIRTDEMRRIEIEDQGQQISDAAGPAFDPTGSVAVPGAAPSSGRQPYTDALKRLDEDPDRLLPYFVQRYGIERVPQRYRDRLKPRG